MVEADDEGDENDEAGAAEPAESGESGHAPVMLPTVLEQLSLSPGETAVDCTAGRGGHALATAKAIGPGGRLIVIDADPANAKFAAERVLRECPAPPTTEALHANFGDLPSLLERIGVGVGGVDAILADLGVSSTHLDDPSRGFSFRFDGPLDMRLDPSRGPTAADLIARADERELADLLFELGEERLSRKIARKIVERRAAEPIRTTEELARLVRGVYRAKGSRRSDRRIDPATRSFMALRIAVNAELESLDRLLAAVPGLMRPGGRVVIISFHSLEDRRVKRAFTAWSHAGLGRRLSRKPLTAEGSELAANPRSRSAKLRGFVFEPPADSDPSSSAEARSASAAVATDGIDDDA
jgi:16S rRNA (cytosine1402-N4)-methyltransferase